MMIIKIDFDENGKHDKDNCEPERPSCSSILLPFLSLLSHRLPSLNMVMMMMMTIAVIILMIMIIIFIINLPVGILASWSLAVSQDWQPPEHDYDNDGDDDDDDDGDDGDDDDDDDGDDDGSHLLFPLLSPVLPRLPVLSPIFLPRLPMLPPTAILPLLPRFALITVLLPVSGPAPISPPTSRST